MEMLHCNSFILNYIGWNFCIMLNENSIHPRKYLTGSSSGKVLARSLFVFFFCIFLKLFSASVMVQQTFFLDVYICFGELKNFRIIKFFCYFFFVSYKSKLKLNKIFIFVPFIYSSHLPPIISFFLFFLFFVHYDFYTNLHGKCFFLSAHRYVILKHFDECFIGI